MFSIHKEKSLVHLGLRLMLELWPSGNIWSAYNTAWMLKLSTILDLSKNIVSLCCTLMSHFIASVLKCLQIAIYSVSFTFSALSYFLAPPVLSACRKFQSPFSYPKPGALQAKRESANK